MTSHNGWDVFWLEEEEAVGGEAGERLSVSGEKEAKEKMIEVTEERKDCKRSGIGKADDVFAKSNDGEGTMDLGPGEHRGWERLVFSPLGDEGGKEKLKQGTSKGDVFEDSDKGSVGALFTKSHSHDACRISGAEGHHVPVPSSDNFKNSIGGLGVDNDDCRTQGSKRKERRNHLARYEGTLIVLSLFHCTTRCRRYSIYVKDVCFFLSPFYFIILLF